MIPAMAKLPFKYLVRDVSRHGKERWYVRRPGVPKVRLHDLRHFHASFLLRSNTHPKVVQERLGHSSISVTFDTYSHSVPSLQREAADIFANQMQQIDVSVDQK